MRRATHKYGAKATVVDGIRFASQKEARRYQELRLLEKAGEIHTITLQPGFSLFVPILSGVAAARIGEYRADFMYCTCPYAIECGRPPESRVVEDVKGFKTPLYLWKKKHIEAQYGIQIREI